MTRAKDYRPLDRAVNGRLSYGLILPHFGEHASARRLLDGAVMAEEAGFDALWVRDHLLWAPHGIDGENRTFVEPLTVLAAIAARTTRIFLGTAVLIPLRWPLKLAQDLASLSYLAGGRVIAGLGLGSGQQELSAVGFQRRHRKRIFVETTEIVQRIWSEADVTHEGELFSFENVTIEPKPAAPIPIWYGGTTDKSVENSVQYCDGWMPGRIPLHVFQQRTAYLQRLCAESGAVVTRGIIPLVKIGATHEAAISGLDIQALAGSSEGSDLWRKPGVAAGEETLEDLEGVIAAGTPEEITEQVMRLAALGLDHFVFDFRLQFEEFERCIELAATEVLPRLKKLGV